MRNRFTQTLTAVAVTSMLAACGGGGGGSDSPSSTQSPTMISSDPNATPTQTTNPQSAPQPVPQPTSTSQTTTSQTTTSPISSALTPNLTPTTTTPNLTPTTAPIAPTTSTSTTPTSTTPTTTSTTSSDSTPTTNTTQPVVESTTPPAQTSPPTPVNPVPVNRSLVDLPDDVQGEQIHLVYAVPKGNVDRGYDLTDRITNSAWSVDNWLQKQTGGKLKMKFDTYQGRLDVTFVQLPRTEAEYNALGWDKLVAIESDMRDMGKMSPSKVYAIWYDGDNPLTCGDANSLQNGHQTTVMYMKGFSNVPGVNPCENNPHASSPTAQPTYLDYVLLHETLHIGGIAHTVDSPYDLMFGGQTRWDEPTKIVLDYNSDDYAFDRSKGQYSLAKPNIYDLPFMQRL